MARGITPFRQSYVYDFPDYVQDREPMVHDEGWRDTGLLAEDGRRILRRSRSIGFRADLLHTYAIEER